MVYKVIWSSLAIKTYISNIEFLELIWTEKEILNFIDAVKRKLQLIANHPNIGSATNKRQNVRKSVIHRRVILFYRVKKRERQIELIQFWSTRQNPGKTKR